MFIVNIVYYNDKKKVKQIKNKTIERAIEGDREQKGEHIQNAR